MKNRFILLSFIIGISIFSYGQIGISGSIGSGISKYRLKTNNYSKVKSDWIPSLLADFYLDLELYKQVDLSIGLGYSILGDKWENVFDTPITDVEYVLRKLHYVDLGVGPKFKTGTN